MDVLLALLGLVLAIGALVAGYRLKVNLQRLSAGVDRAIQTASRSRIASDSAAATLARDQDTLWRMRSDVDGARRDVEGLRTEVGAIRTDVDALRGRLDGVHQETAQEIADLRKDIAAIRRVLLALRDELDDLRKDLNAARAGEAAGPLPLPSHSHSDTLEMLRQQLRAEQQAAQHERDED